MYTEKKKKTKFTLYKTRQQPTIIKKKSAQDPMSICQQVINITLQFYYINNKQPWIICKAKEKDKITHKTKPRSNCPNNQEWTCGVTSVLV
jgi:hypothetical protein